MVNKSVLGDILYSVDQIKQTGLAPTGIIISYAAMVDVARDLIDGFHADELFPYIDANISQFKIYDLPVYISTIPVNMGVPFFIAAA